MIYKHAHISPVRTEKIFGSEFLNLRGAIVRKVQNDNVLWQQAAREITNGIPYWQEANGQNGEEDDDNVQGMNADGVGIDDKRALAAAQRDDAVGLLNPAE